MKIIGINHIGLAPKDVTKAKWFFGEVLGLNNIGSELVIDQKTTTHIFGSGEGHGESLLEFLEDAPGESGPIGKFLEKKGSGLHHLALEVEDVTEAIAHMKSNGVDMIHEAPRSGVCKTTIAFVHPRSTGGLLVELVERSKA